MGTGLSAVSQVGKTVNCKVLGEESHALTLKGNRRHRDQPGARPPVWCMRGNSMESSVLGFTEPLWSKSPSFS